ncbi:MAG: site-specific integrase [Planctomycetaceae bacterium]
MATVYRPTYSHGGKKKKIRKWYIRYRDHEGRLRKIPGFTDKGETQRLAAKLEHEAELIRKGLLPVVQPEQTRTLKEELQAFQNSLLSKEVSQEQVSLVAGRCERLINGCQFIYAKDIDPVQVESWLAQQRRGSGGRSKKREGISVQTSNHYLRAIKQFTRWLQRHKRLQDDPLTHLEMLNVAVDRRHDRRALTDDEVSRLLKATLQGKPIFGVSPEDRHMLYVMALSTGLRASELGSLRKESLSLDSNPPTVQVKAGYSKRRRLDILPIPTEILPAARQWLATKKDGALLWPSKWAKNRAAGKMLKQDLQAAEIEYQNADGLFADFHSLRHTYISNLARNGVPLAAAQKLARHSTPVLTAAQIHAPRNCGSASGSRKAPPLQLGRIYGALQVSFHVPNRAQWHRCTGNRRS